MAMTRQRDALSRLLLAILLLGTGLIAGPARAERIKDVATLQGVRSNQLIGYGLVVGLDGGGDKNTSSPQTSRACATSSPAGRGRAPIQRLKPKNVAAVSLTAELPPFAKPGMRIDVTVSSIGDAKELREAPC